MIHWFVIIAETYSNDMMSKTLKVPVIATLKPSSLAYFRRYSNESIKFSKIPFWVSEDLVSDWVRGKKQQTKVISFED